MEEKYLEPIPEVEVSPFDTSYPAVLLSNGIKNQLAKAQDAAQSIYKAVSKEMPMLIQVKQAMSKGCRYVVDASESTIKAIEKGTLKLTEENGKMYAQFKKNGKYGSKLPIKKESFRKFDSTQMANALQMQAIQDQLEEVSNQLMLIDGSVREVLQGQQNDRIGLYYSGISLFFDSKNISDVGLKISLQSQALRAITESTFKLKLKMESDIRYIKNEEYKTAKGKQKELIEEHLSSINQCFAFIHQSMLLRAGIYCDIGELPAMARVLDEYSAFIETDVASNAKLLSQYDKNDDGTNSGLWSTRSKLKLDTNDLVKSLNNPQKTLYLSISEEN